jgi:hypothetical protein
MGNAQGTGWDDPADKKHRRAHRRYRNLVQKDNKFKGYRHKPLTAYKRNKKVDIEID